MKRRLTLLATLALLACAPLAARAAAPFQKGSGYEVLNVPQPVGHPGKVVVTEFFWYNCPHCNALEPEFDAWVRRQPSYVVVERVPVAFTAQFVPQQKLYYTLLALGKADALQGPIFQAIHQQHIVLNTPEQMATWLAAHGVPRQSFLSTFNSFGVAMQARRASQMTKDYGIDGVPTVAVQGTYEVSADLPQTPDDASILRAVDYLVAQVHDGGAAAR
ncbi:MAG: thiol:disulfide interchange protein DsbA/DsbL [Betaproteobacteria bacterium]|nr:thiol:disulfide interchange protein DsbA/DsbL [Betaproteobacteria bacterium]